MSGLKISQFPVILNANLKTGDSIPVVDSAVGDTKQITVGQLDLRYQGVPNGGTTSQVLAKASGTNKDVYWKSISKNDVGLGLVDNTSDLNKPISNAVQAALNLKANSSALASKADTSYVNTQLGNKQDKLPAGNDGEVLTLDGGVPVWAPSGGGPGSVTSVFGRTGTVTAQIGDYDKTMIGLDQVDNTSDLDKPISNLTQTALNGKEASLPSVTGNDGKFLGLVAGSKVWVTPPTGIPNGGTTGQSLVKTSGADGAVGWATVEPRITVSTTQVITSSDMVVIDNTKSRQRIKIMGDLGPAYSSLPAGAIDGQELYLQGVSDDEPVILEAWSTADLGGALSITFTKNVLKFFIWDHGQSLWILVGA